jgi:hypothetical protein
MGILFDTMMRMQNGESPEEIRRSEIKEGKARVKSDKKNKSWGECESCQYETVLVKEVGLCGPCCFGESATYNGNF